MGLARLRRASARRVAGWWAINQAGHSIAPPVDKGKLLNAVPGVDGVLAALYNGDGPADRMGAALELIIAEYEAAWGRKPWVEEIQGVWQFCANLKMLQGYYGLRSVSEAGILSAEVPR